MRFHARGHCRKLVPAAAHADAAQGIAIDVGKQGDVVVVDVDFMVPATPGEAWEALTDFDRMADFLPKLEFSKKINGAGNQLQVAQKD
ncbi:MAG: SRPBCC family protein [Noviherbaspirillum sp.]